MAKKCSKCKKSRNLEHFWKNKAQRDGLDQYCKECRKKYSLKHRRVYYERNKESQKIKNNARHMGYYQESKEYAVDFLGGKCEKCGNKKFEQLCFHHRDPGQKSFNISGVLRKPLKSIKNMLREELLKCELVCRNCHATIHHELLLDLSN